MDNSSQLSSQELQHLCTYLWNLRNFSMSSGLQKTTSTCDGIWVTSVIISIITCIAGLLGNAIVIWIASVKMKNVNSNIWFLNLALADFGFLLLLPLWLVSVLQDKWLFGIVLCKAHHFAVTVNMYVSIFILTALSIDRSISVALPLWHREHVSRVHYLAICLALWAITVLLSIPVLIQSQVVTASGNQQCVLVFYGEDVFSVNNLLLNSSQCETDEGTAPLAFTPVMTISEDIYMESTMATYLSILTTETGNHSEVGNMPPDINETILSSVIFIPSFINPLVKPDFAMSFPGIPLDHQDCESEAFQKSMLDCINASEVGKWQQMLSSVGPIVIARAVIGFFIPLIIIIASNLLIIVKVRQSQQAKTGKYIRLYVVILVMVAVYFLSWMPLTVAEIMTVVAVHQMDVYRMSRLSSITPLVSCIASFNSCLNPILYVIIGHNVKTQLKKSIWSTWQSITSSSQSTVHSETSNPKMRGNVLISLS